MSDTEQEQRPAHEPDRAYLRPLFIFWFVLLVMVGISLLLVSWAFGIFTRTAEQREAPPPALTGSQEPPPPRLQVNPEQELKAMRANEDVHLKTYRWIDRQTGVIGIPVSRAIDLLSERGIQAAKPKP